MNDTVAFTGGARLGWVQATSPFGRLSIAPGQLTISLAFAGRHTLAPSEVSAFEHVGIASNGLRIVHTRDDVPQPIIFWCGGARLPRLVDALAQAGFDARVPASPRRRGIPVHWLVIAQLVGGFLLATLVLRMLFG